MKYYLEAGNKGCVLLRRVTDTDDIPQLCPFIHDRDMPEEVCCGSWCPLFQVYEYSRIPQVDGSVTVRREVKLHCGAGTRTIGIEEEAT